MWKHETKIGPFFIVQKVKRFHIIYDGEDLGSYARPDQAADDLSGGHTDWPSIGIDTGELGIPDDLSEWEFLNP